MGLFASFVFDGTGWSEIEPGVEPVLSEPALFLDIHDSDIGTVVYRPVGRGAGIAYMGVTPRTYFADATASEPTDPVREAEALAVWCMSLRGEVDPQGITRLAERLRPFLAADDAPPVEDDGQLDDADVFVEFKAVRFLQAMELSVPESLAS